jgi:hypothetical protein
MTLEIDEIFDELELLDNDTPDEMVLPELHILELDEVEQDEFEVLEMYQIDEYD